MTARYTTTSDVYALGIKLADYLFFREINVRPRHCFDISLFEML